MELYSTYTDERLSQLLRSSDRAAFTEIYDRYWDKLYSVAANKLKDAWLAEELVQDIFLDLWRRREQLDLSDKVAAYLAVAMKYKVINAQVKRSRLQLYQDYANRQGWLADYSTENQLSFDELKDRLAKLVAKLPKKCRLIYKLSREAGYSQKEIARELDISEKTVESHLSRAIKSLRTSLSQFLFFLLSGLAVILRFLF
jgi:RNA polymerase sigma-70 factor (ECF subfamily)